MVGAPQPVGQNDPERKVLGELTDDRFRPVTAAYFDGEETDGEETSDYIRENPVSSAALAFLGGVLFGRFLK